MYQDIEPEKFRKIIKPWLSKYFERLLLDQYAKNLSTAREPSLDWASTVRIYDYCSSTSNSNRGRKILSIRLRSNRFFFPGRTWFTPQTRRAHSFAFTVHRRFIADRISTSLRFSIMRDLPTDFRSDRCTGCPETSVRKNAFPGRHSRVFCDPISARGTSDVSELFVISATL